MPEGEPNKKWDALLRAYAKKTRREVGLHPVARRALQDEVAKTFGAAPKRADKRSILSQWWVRGPLAATFAAFAVLLIIQNRHFEETKTPNDRMTTTAGAKASESAATMDQVKSKPAFTGGAIAGGGGANMTARAAAPVAAPAREMKAFDNVSQNARRQLFQNGMQSQKVLNSFQVERDGDRVVVTDGDGSIYRGQVLAPKVETATSYSFAVQGVNNSSQQTVDFKARLDAPPVQTQTVNGVVSNGLNQNQAARVSGTATLGLTNQIRVDAVPAP